MAKLNLKNVQEIAHGDRFFIVSILSVFISESQEYWGDVEKFYRQDSNLFRAAVHKAKSAASNIASGDLLEQLLTVELNAQNGAFPEKDHLTQLGKSWMSLVEEAKLYVAEN